jgi:selT/selW/selH-like putative selenoprotein
LKAELDKEFGRDIEVVGEATPTTTGYLEVSIVGGPVLHSKKNGDGYVDTPAKKQKIINGIRAALR